MTDETPAEAKARLRRSALANRTAIAGSIRDGFSDSLRSHGVRLAEILKPEAVSAFHPIRNEPDTLALLGALAAAGFPTALPVTGPPGTALTFRLWRPGDPTVLGPMNIREPSPDAAAVDPELLFVPLVAFDRWGYRIGYGGGYYDRTLAGLRDRLPIRSVGVGYASCEIKCVPHEPYDEPMDFIVTEKEFIYVAQSVGVAETF